jgi:hypothetical protein
MPIDMLLHDTRLLGRPPAIAENIYEFDATVSVAHILGWTKVVADGGGGLRRLIIMCHGFEAADTHHGGWGLQFGAEGITSATAPLFANLRGKVRVIVVYACKSVDIDVRHGHSGMMLWKQIASIAQCNVVGSDSDQVYTYGASNPIDFGKWEGTVYVIAPNGNSQPIDPDFSLP